MQLHRILLGRSVGVRTSAWGRLRLKSELRAGLGTQMGVLPVFVACLGALGFGFVVRDSIQLSYGRAGRSRRLPRGEHRRGENGRAGRPQSRRPRTLGSDDAKMRALKAMGWQLMRAGDRPRDRGRFRLLDAYNTSLTCQGSVLIVQMALAARLLS